MRGLRCGMDNHRYIASELRKDTGDCAFVSDVDIIVAITYDFAFEVTTTPFCARLRPEKLPTHVIINAKDLQSFGCKEPRRLRADQSRRTGNEGEAHSIHPLSSG